MNKASIKFLSLLLVACTLLWLCACGKPEQSKSEVVTVTQIVTVTEIVTVKETEPTTIPQTEPTTVYVEPIPPELTFALNPDGVSYAVTECFKSATGKIVIPSKYAGKPVTRIEDSAFKNCNNITEVIIPDSIVYIGKFCFDGCLGLSYLVIPESVVGFGKWFIASTELDYIIFHNKKYTDIEEFKRNFKNEYGISAGVEYIEKISQGTYVPLY